MRKGESPAGVDLKVSLELWLALWAGDLFFPRVFECGWYGVLTMGRRGVLPSSLGEGIYEIFIISCWWETFGVFFWEWREAISHLNFTNLSTLRQKTLSKTYTHKSLCKYSHKRITDKLKWKKIPSLCYLKRPSMNYISGGDRNQIQFFELEELVVADSSTRIDWYVCGYASSLRVGIQIYQFAKRGKVTVNQHPQVSSWLIDKDKSFVMR